MLFPGQPLKLAAMKRWLIPVVIFVAGVLAGILLTRATDARLTQQKTPTSIGKSPSTLPEMTIGEWEKASASERSRFCVGFAKATNPNASNAELLKICENYYQLAEIEIENLKHPDLTEQLRERNRREKLSQLFHWLNQGK
jgi:hypothetical protein